MRPALHFHLILMAVLPAIFFTLAFHPAGSDRSGREAAAAIRAGSARVNITPYESLPMSGYAGREGGFTGIRDSLYATALVLEQGGVQVCLLTPDLIGFSHEFRRDFSAAVEGATGIPRDNVVIAATHNHGGPVTRAYGERVSPELDKYLDDLQQGMIRAVAMAQRDLQPVRMGYGEGESRMNINRRTRHPEGGIWLGKNPYGVCDHRIGVWRIDKADGKPMAMMVNWPCHATVNGQTNMRITGDWPGAAARYLREKYGEELQVLVTAGASGDIDPIYGPNDSFSHIDEIGLRVADEVQRVAAQLVTLPQGGLAVAQRELMAPGRKPSSSRLPGQSLEPGEDVPLRLTVVRAGNMTLAGVSGEVMTEIGMEIRDMLGPQSMVLTHCNGSSGYLCTDAAYEEGGYESMVARVMPGVAGLITEGIREMMMGLE